VSAAADTWPARVVRGARLPALALIAFAAMPLLGAACGGDDDDADPSPTPAASPTAAARGSNDAARAMDRHEVPEDLADGMALGKADAKATLQVYEDFQCPNCLSYTIRVEPLILEEYVKAGKLRYEFHNFPILGEESVYAAAGAVCAATQDAFWDYHDELFFIEAEAGQLMKEQLNVGRFDPDALLAVAVQLGMDGPAFQACMEDPATIQTVQADFTAARNAGLRGTPGFVLNGTAVAYPANDAAWRQLLDGVTK
jgi:protein-disulfide isomerase